MMNDLIKHTGYITSINSTPRIHSEFSITGHVLEQPVFIVAPIADGYCFLTAIMQFSSQLNVPESFVSVSPRSSPIQQSRSTISLRGGSELCFKFMNVHSCLSKFSVTKFKYLIFVDPSQPLPVINNPFLSGVSTKLPPKISLISGIVPYNQVSRESNIASNSLE